MTIIDEFNKEEIELPFAVLQEIVARRIKNSRISAIERMSPADVLGYKP